MENMRVSTLYWVCIPQDIFAHFTRHNEKSAICKIHGRSKKTTCSGSSCEVKNKKWDFFFSFLKPLSFKREFALKILTNVHDPTVF